MEQVRGIAVDFDKPLVVIRSKERYPDSFDHRRDEYIVESYANIRVLCRDRISPVGYSAVVLLNNPKAYFGPEEYVCDVRPDTGSINHKGFSGVYLINVEDEDRHAYFVGYTHAINEHAADVYPESDAAATNYKRGYAAGVAEIWGMQRGND